MLTETNYKKCEKDVSDFGNSELIQIIFGKEIVLKIVVSHILFKLQII
jgi:hypothetical protein